NRDARVLMAIGKARDPRVPGAIQPPPASLVQRVKGKVDPLDHDGDKRKGGAVTADAMAELRKEYTQVVGKKPFAGWGAAELRHRINEASSSWATLARSALRTWGTCLRACLSSTPPRRCRSSITSTPVTIRDA